MIILAVAVVVTKPGHTQTTGDGPHAIWQEVLAHPDDLDLGYRYAQVLILAGEFDEAAAELERLLIIDPAQPRLRTELGFIYFRLGLYYLAVQQSSADCAGSRTDSCAAGACAELS